MRIMPTAWLLLALAAMAILHFLLPLASVLAMPWSLAGMLPLLGGALNLIADHDFHRVGTSVRPFERSSVLLTHGIFRFSRNPMYLGFVLVLIGTSLLLGSFSPWLVIPPFLLILSTFYVCREEAMLAAAFGECWQEYRGATRRWI